MKTISQSWFWIFVIGLVVIAFAVGRYVEQTVVLQGDVNDLKGRVGQLEKRNIRHAECLGWIAKIGSCIPLVRHFVPLRLNS